FGIAGEDSQGKAALEGRTGPNAILVSFLTGPTPGRSNSPPVCLGPRIELLTHQPPAPSPDQPLTVTARVSPRQGSIAEVRLLYRVMFGREQSLVMFDDGEHGDGAAGDGVYGAIIPGSKAKAGQMIRYAVVSKDAAGQVSRWPLFADRPEYSAYQGTVYTD